MLGHADFLAKFAKDGDPQIFTPIQATARQPPSRCIAKSNKDDPTFGGEDKCVDSPSPAYATLDQRESGSQYDAQCSVDGALLVRLAVASRACSHHSLHRQ